jgi:cytoskeletal protein RodZ
MKKPDMKDLKSKLEQKVDPQHRGFFHTRTFHVILGVGIVLLILILYNCVIRTDRAVTPEQEELNKQHESMYLDTFDVVGDYLFPPMKNTKDDVSTDDEKDDKQKEKTENKESKPAAEEEEIIESADISSDPTPAPPTPVQPAAPAPTIETIEQ